MRFFLSGGSPPSTRDGSSSPPPSPRAGQAPHAGAPAASAPPATPPAAGRPVLDVLNPLNALVGFATMLAEGGSELTPELRHRYASRVREAAATLRRTMSVLGRSRDGKGLDLTEDWVSSGTFPVAPEASPPAGEEPEPAERPAREAEARFDGATRPRVFVVDADDANRELVAEYLGDRGYDLVLLAAADEALYEAEARPPDLVLIDPLTGDDGFHLARALKASNARGFVPLVFVTAAVDDDARVRAVDAGAEQIVKKPVNRHELRARVKSLLQLRAHQEALAVQNAQLKSLQRFKDETTAMLVHDLKSPLSAMMMNLDFALDDLPVQPESADVHNALAESRAAGSKLFRIIANLLDIARSDDGRLVPKRSTVDVDALFARVIENHAAEATARKVTITKRLRLDETIEADPDILARVLANLVESALRYAHAGGSIVLGASAGTGSDVELTVSNDGRPISPDLRALLFEKYPNVAPSQAVNRGLGLYFCRIAVEAHGGRIDLIDAPPATTCFRIQLPQS